MADKVSNENTVQMVAEFGDGSQQIINQPNPTTENLISKIQAFSAFAVNNKIFISEKSDATISRIKSAKTIEKTTVDFDLGND